MSRPSEHAAVGGQRRDELLDAGQDLDVAACDLVREQLDVARDARVDERVDDVVRGAEPLRQVVHHLRLRLAFVAADDRLGVARAPQVGEVADDARVGAPVEGVVAELALDAVHVADGAHDRAAAGAVGVDQRAVDVEEDEAVAWPGQYSRTAGPASAAAARRIAAVARAARPAGRTR